LACISTALFADVSGFTAISEALGKSGKAGTEQLTAILNSYFDPMIDLIHSYGGIIGKFGGDAMTVLFPFTAENQTDTIRRAIQCAVDMQANMGRYDAIPTSAGGMNLRRIKVRNLFRYCIVGSLFVLMLLMFTSSVVQAGWVRLGGGAPQNIWYYEVFKACPDGVLVGVGRSIATTHETVWIVQGNGATPVGSNVTAYTRVSLTYHDEAISAGGDTFNYYGIAFIPYSTTINTSLDTMQMYASHSPIAGFVNAKTYDPNCTASENKPFDPGDNRVNREPWQSAAIYCRGGEVEVYGINGEGVGFQSLYATAEEIAAVGVPDVNTLIKTGASAYGPPIRLYRLTTGEFQINAPGLPPEISKEYVHIWNC